MRLSALMDQLKDIADMYPEADPEVLLAQQPRWPFECSIGQVVVLDANADEREEWEEAPEEERPAGPPPEPDVRVYIGEGSQLAYLSGAASRELGWR